MDARDDLEIPSSIQTAGVPEGEFLARLDALAVDAFNDQCTGAHPRYPLMGELRSILLDSYYRCSFVETAHAAEEFHRRIIEALNTHDPVFAKRLVTQAIGAFIEETRDVVESGRSL